MTSKPEFGGQQIRNALCGYPPDYKTWQDYYQEGNMSMVAQRFRELAARDAKNIHNGIPGLFKVFQEVKEWEKHA